MSQNEGTGKLTNSWPKLVDHYKGSINTGISRRFLSDETRWQGWIYFLREQRTYFVAIRSGLELGYSIPIEYAPHWRIDVPLNSRLVYAGTLHYMGENKGFWNDRNLAPYKWLMRNEEDLAKEVAARHLPDLGPPLTILMQHTPRGKILLRTPKYEKNE